MFGFKCFSKSASLVRYFNCAITSVEDHYHILLCRHVSKHYSLPTICRLFDTNSKIELIAKAPSLYQKVSSISSPTGFFCPTYYIFFPKQCLLAAPVVFIPLFWITGQTFTHHHLHALFWILCQLSA